MATIYTVLRRDSHATREEILQHVCPDELLARSQTNRWLYYHPTILAIKIAYYSDTVRRLSMLIERLTRLQVLYR